VVAIARLEIQILTDALEPDWPRAEFLIDGQPMLAGTKLSDWMGFDPGDILHGDLPLLPAEPSRRVALYRCGCGESGCGVVAPLIVLRSNGVVHWTDFRDYTGVFSGPTVAEDPDGGHEHKLPELTFDRAQYEAEVMRATGDRSWETERRATAQVVRRLLMKEQSKLAELGYRLDWVAPERGHDAVLISLTKDRRQHLLSMPFGEGSPEGRADRLTGDLWSRPPTQWQSAFGRDGRL
jgi:hypothetical protein